MENEVKVFLGIIVSEYETKKVKILANSMDEAEKMFNELAALSGSIVEDVMEV